MATEKLSSDVYDIANYIEEIKLNHIPESQTTLSLGIFGYLNDVFSNSLQNTIRMSSEYSNEAIATRARFEKNVITHALNLGINKINATPAIMNVILMFPEEYVLQRMENDRFTYDHNVKIYIGDFEFHTDYNIIIRKNIIANQEVVYTAMYDIDGLNPLSDITDPYLPPIGRITYGSNQVMLLVSCFIRQVEYVTEHRKILTDNPIENKTMIFEYEDQLAAFNVDVYETGRDETIHLTPVYEGLYDYDAAKYCNYSYIDSNTIRIKFDRDSYEPALNCDVDINIRLTQGAGGNFSFKDEVKVDLVSDDINYDGMYMIVKPRGNEGSKDGIDKKSIDDLKKIIPKEALAHGCIINTQDLENFFNSINTDNCKLYFYKNRDNPLERLYYSYIILKNNDNILPTNTIDVKLKKDQLEVTEEGNLLMKPGTLVYLNPENDYGEIISKDVTAEEKAQMNEDGFLYINPFLTVLNRSPLYTSYFLNIINVEKDLNFTYINQNSVIQYIASTIAWKRAYFTDRNIYKMTIEMVQNINIDLDMLIYDKDQNVIGTKLKVCAVIYDDQQVKPLRWIEAEFIEFSQEDFSFKFEFKFETNDIIDDNNRIRIENMYDLGTTRKQYAYLKERVKCQILVFGQFDQEYGRDDTDMYIPGLEGYTLCNKYDIVDNLEMFYNYSHIVSSAILLSKDDTDATIYELTRVPLVRDRYINSEKRINTFIKEMELRRKYIEDSLMQLEDSFGIDFKFFNTYGPSNLFYVEGGSLINRTNLSMTFKMKPITQSDIYVKDRIIVDIKEYLEDINEITDLHIPNLITQITNTYREQLVYFEFVDINGYGPGSQHVYRPDEYTGDVVPEFLNVNVTDEDEPDINIIVM